MGFRPRFKTPLSRARDAAVQYAVRPFEYFSPRTRTIIGVSFLIIITTLLLSRNYWSSFAEEYKEGDVVTRTVVSPADITTIDIAETEKRRDAAREATRPVFNYDSTRTENSAQSFRAAWEDLKKQSGSNS